MNRIPKDKSPGRDKAHKMPLQKLMNVITKNGIAPKITLSKGKYRFGYEERRHQMDMD